MKIEAQEIDLNLFVLLLLIFQLVRTVVFKPGILLFHLIVLQKDQVAHFAMTLVTFTVLVTLKKFRRQLGRLWGLVTWMASRITLLVKLSAMIIIMATFCVVTT